MTFRLPLQISRAGAFCRPISPNGLGSRLTPRKGNLKKLSLYQTKKNPSANILQGYKHKIAYVPTRYNSTKLNGEHFMKQNACKPMKKSKSKLISKECEGNDYYQKMDEINFGPYFNRRPIQAKSKIKTARTRCKATPPQPKYDFYGMENYYDEIENIEDKMSRTAKPIICPPQPDINNILPDTDLKIQNDIWQQSGPEIINNLNSKHSMWKFIYGKRKTLKHDFWQDFSPAKMFNKLIQTPVATKSSVKGSRIRIGTKHHSNIYLPTKRKSVKLNLESNTEKFLDIPSKLQQRLLHKIKQCNTNRERILEAEEKTFLTENTGAESNAATEISETKNLITDCKYRTSHLPLKLSPSKIFVRHQSKSSRTCLKPNTFIELGRKPLSKHNVIMAAVNNRQLNNPSPEFMNQYNYNNSFYHMNAMQDMESFNEFNYPKISYNAENDAYLKHNELVVEGAIPNDIKIVDKKSKSINTIGKPGYTKPTVSDKKIKAISVRKLVSTVKATNLEELKDELSKSNKQKMAKIETALSKKREQKVRHKIKTTRIPKTLGEIYGVGKIPFLVEVSKPGQAKDKQYLIVIQLQENKRQEKTENNTNSPIPLTLNIDFNSDLLKETLLSPSDSYTNCLKAETNLEQNVTSKKHVPKVGSMIGLNKAKNKILPLLEINDYKGFEPILPIKLSQLIDPKNNKKEDNPEWSTQKTYSEEQEQETSKDTEEQPKIAAYCSPNANSNDRCKDMKEKLQRILNTNEYIKTQQQQKLPVLCNQVRQFSTSSRKNQPSKTLNYKIHPKVRHTKRTVDYQQKRNLCCVVCATCGQCPCVCCTNPCSPCGWYPCCSGRPKCCPKFQLDYCCPRARWDCSIPIPPCRKIDAPYASYGECMPMWCKEPTECFDYEQHKLQPKNQVSQKIHLMQESIPKVTVVDPALQRKCCRDKWCEPCYPCIDQRICFEGPYKIPVDYCCPRGRPHCYCWPERPCCRRPPPYRCFSDEDLEFPEVEITEHDLARKFASDLYRRMGRKCALPFAPACRVDCDLRTGEPIPVRKFDPKGHCATTCLPPGTYPAYCTPVRIPPCEIPGCDTCINCCMPMQGIKKTRCYKNYCPQDCCGCCPKDYCGCCPKDCPKDCTKDCPKDCPKDCCDDD